jgi:hypothetical protein
LRGSGEKEERERERTFGFFKVEKKSFEKEGERGSGGPREPTRPDTREPLLA